MSSDPTEALALLLAKLNEKIDLSHGGKDHPWIPGANFADGELWCAIDHAKDVLRQCMAEELETDLEHLDPKDVMRYNWNAYDALYVHY